MLKETIKYTDYDGVEQEEDFYFNMSKAQFVELELTEKGGVVGMLDRVGKTRDPKQIMLFMKDFVSKVYGIKSPDGKSHIKSEEISRAFENTEAYSELFTKLCTDANYAIRFIIGVLPLKDDERVNVLNEIKKLNLDDEPEKIEAQIKPISTNNE